MSGPGHAITVVADDLTGANATAGRFAARGARAVTVLGAGLDAASLPPAEAVVVSTASRHLPAEEAARAVATAIAQLQPTSLVAKRIDTTLRGNVGAEIGAALQAAAADGPVRALVVPAFPDAGRITVGGLQLVGQQPVSRTEAARDPWQPVTSSRVRTVLAEQLDRQVDELDLDAVGDPVRLAQQLADSRDLVVVDAVDDGDLATIARAAADVARRDGVTWVPCDPGPFTAAYAEALGLLGAVIDPVLVVAGSVTAASREQLAELERHRAAELVHVDVDDLDGERLGRELAERCAGGAPVVGVHTAGTTGDVQRLTAAAADRIADELGRAAAVVLDRAAAAGLYLTGGDITGAVLRALGAQGLRVDDEVLPLAVVGRVQGGPHEGTLVATKGGLVGGADAAVRCVDAVRATARATRAARHEEPL